MTTIAAVLLVPEEGDPYGLLKRGPLGQRPPTYIVPFEPVADRTEIDVAGSDPIWRCPHCYECVSYYYSKEQAVERIVHQWTCRLRALALAWNGEPIADGLVRVLLLLDTIAMLRRVCRDLMTGGEHAKAARETWGQLGALILLDEKNNEVDP